MRYQRVRKFRNRNRKYFNMIKVVCTWYALILFVNIFITDTSAKFLNSAQINGEISAGYWQNSNSHLEQHNAVETKELEVKQESHNNSPQLSDQITFLPSKNQTLQACTNIELQVELEYFGDTDLQDTLSYSVYYIEDGEPLDGNKLKQKENERIIPILRSGEKVTLTYETAKPGMYQFVLLQSENPLLHEDIKSEIFFIHCEENNEQQMEVPLTETIHIQEEDIQKPTHSPNREALETKQEDENHGTESEIIETETKSDADIQ